MGVLYEYLAPVRKYQDGTSALSTTDYFRIVRIYPIVNDHSALYIELSALYCPTNAHNVKKRRVIKTFLKIRKLLPTCFGLQGNHHQGATAST